MFGLLLVSAIGIDYAVYMKTVHEEPSHKRITLTLAACTTLISFLLLAISSTPAVATFWYKCQYWCYNKSFNHIKTHALKTHKMTALYDKKYPFIMGINITNSLLNFT